MRQLDDLKENAVKCYAGIGSRQTPACVLTRMTQVAMVLDERGYVLRSGGADGADTAFEVGARPSRRQIFLPWKNFNDNHSPLCFGADGLASDKAMEMAAQFHPFWHRLSEGARKLHARNCFQVLGPKLDDPVEFIICWTEGGTQTGGTAQALRIAHRYPIYVCNLGAPGGDDDLTSLLEVA